MSGYDDIINLPYPQKSRRMSNHNRAAQFSPFAALTGFGAAIEETARLTDRKIELDQEEMARLNKKLLKIEAHIQERPEVTVTYFVADLRKSGGAYVEKSGQVKKLDPYERMLVFCDGDGVPVEDVIDICLEEDKKRSPFWDFENQI